MKNIWIKNKIKATVILIIVAFRKEYIVKKNILRAILVILLLGTFYMIFGFSSQDGEESSGVSRKVTETLTSNSKKIQNLEKKQKQLKLKEIEHFVRKLAHFSIYTLVGTLLMALMSTYEIKQRNRIVTSLITGIIYASSDEIHQSFTPGRSPMITDVLIDTLGVCLGISIIIFIIRIYRNFYKKRQISIEKYMEI